MLFEAIIVIVLASLISEYVNLTLGLGYGMLMAPLLLLAGYSPLQIIPALLATQLFAGVIGAYTHHQFKNVNFHEFHTRKSTLFLITTNILGVVLAVFLAISIPEAWIAWYIGLLALTIGVATLASRKMEFNFSWKKLGFFGTLAGFNKGISGGGYGPVMMGGQLMTGIDPKRSVGVTLLAEGITSFIGFSIFLAVGRITDWNLTLFALLGAFLSLPAAVYTAKKMESTKIKLAIGAIVTLLGVITLAKLLL